MSIRLCWFGNAGSDTFSRPIRFSVQRDLVSTTLSRSFSRSGTARSSHVRAHAIRAVVHGVHKRRLRHVVCVGGKVLLATAVHGDVV